MGSEEIVNGGFSNGSANWGNYITGSSTVVFTDVATLNVDASNSNVGIYQENVFASGKQYKVVVRMKASSSFDAELLETQGAVTISTIGSVSLTTSYQDFTFYFTGTGSNDIFIHRKYNASSANQSITIDNVSVKEYLGQEVVPDSGCGSWLLENQSTNLLNYSESFSNSYWTKVGASVTNNITSPDGTNNAYKLVEDTSNGTHQIYSSFINGSASNDYTTSFFVKAAERNWCRIMNYGGAVVYFDLENGVIGTESNASGKIEALSNGWYKVSSTYVSQSSERAYLHIAESNDTVSYQGDGTSGIYFWGAQVEEQSYATSYIPTNGATSTRLQDIANNSGNSTLINSTEGVLYAEIAALVDDLSFRTISLSDGTTSNRCVLRYGGTTNRVNVLISSGGSIIFDNNFTLTEITDFSKIAVKWKVNDFALWVDGVERATDSSGAAPIGLSQLQLSNYNSSSNDFYGKCKALAVFPILSNTELQSLTTI